MSEKNNKSLFGPLFGDYDDTKLEIQKPASDKSVQAVAVREPRHTQTRKKIKQKTSSDEGLRTTLRIPSEIKEKLCVMLQLSDKGQNEYIVGLIEKDLNKNRDRIEAYKALKKE
ncbi:MAG TPA: hypothetical protein PK675_02085 [Clostridia bacterium]|nr:hypothetical protein [Clostridia bacterium]